ncbi:hypothetical protein V6N13_105607 [Hibiscus sabdariffa]|uniref:Uncharacterized protein n=1 Tax=Hibiscus sabdariffa TaxID=183260 RepID=A0ABR2EY74_9ROSI
MQGQGQGRGRDQCHRRGPPVTLKATVHTTLETQQDSDHSQALCRACAFPSNTYKFEALKSCFITDRQTDSDSPPARVTFAH